MTKKDLTEFLQSYDDDTEILITDGMDCNCYRGKFKLQEWKTEDGKVTVDIGVGGCLENYD